MKEKLFFYRKLHSNDFFQSENEKNVIAVRIKNKFFPESVKFDSQSKKWEKMDALPSADENQVFAEYAETPIFSARPTTKTSFAVGRTASIEDFSVKDMKAYLDWRKNQSRANLNSSLFVDCDGIKKDYFGAIFESDDKKLTFKLTFLKFDRPEDENQSVLPEDVTYTCEEFFFDLRNEVFSTNLKSYKEQKDYDEIGYLKIKMFFSRTEPSYPKDILRKAYEKYLNLAEKLTKIKYDSQKTLTPNDNQFKQGFLLLEMYKVLTIPYEPNLCQVIFSKEFKDAGRKFKYRRKNSKILKKFLKKMKIKDYRVLRKCYAERPETLLACLRLKDAGFKDINLYNRVIEDAENCQSILHYPRNSFVFFSKYSLKHRGEIATLNVLLRDYEDPFEAYDAIDMFADYFKHIPETLRKDVLTEGFTHFNHDALSNLTYRVDNGNYTFEYSKKQKSLEDDISGYEFRLPETSWQMCEIGTSLHNCVASYAKSVRKNECTIVYAKKDGDYKICIELRDAEKGFITAQERVDHNSSPDNEEKKALSLWHEKHGIRNH